MFPALQNHFEPNTLFIPTSTFEEFVHALNSAPGYVDDIFVYLHGDDMNLSFYYAQYFSADKIGDAINEISINGDIYLFSCKGGRGKLASAIAKSTNCKVIASMYKVSFDSRAARCGWINYLQDVMEHGLYSWYSFEPNGVKEPISYFWIST
jgi:hypothetical protein